MGMKRIAVLLVPVLVACSSEEGQGIGGTKGAIPRGAADFVGVPLPPPSPDEADASTAPSPDDPDPRDAGAAPLPRDASTQRDAWAPRDASRPPAQGGYLDPCDDRVCAPGLECVRFDPAARPFCTYSCGDAGTHTCSGLVPYTFCVADYCATYCDTRAGNPRCPSGKGCVELTDTGAGVCAPP